MVDKHKVNIFYTAPTAIRSLMERATISSSAPHALRCACSERSANRSIRKPGVVLSRCRRRALPYRRYLVAD
ncbi:hypothetical protein F2981_05760 [Sinorhizobium meliloti]|nr:hypothetical protein [Sinorhizobium meliloti]